MAQPTLVTNRFSSVAPIKQHHRNGCWAACLEWWSRGVLGCSGYTQDSIRKIDSVKALYSSDSTNGKTYKKNASRYGTLETHELIGLLQSSPWYISAQQVNNFNGNILQQRLNRGPVVIGFFDLSGNTWHVNVICGYDPILDMAVVMEPRTGKFMDKSLADFTVNSPFNVLGWRV